VSLDVTVSADRLGRASRKAAKAALEAHVGALEGEGLKRAIASALAENAGLGGQERRFVAVAARELSRHLRLLDALAKHRRAAPSLWELKQDAALVRYAIWRRLTGADWSRIGPEVRLPGPIRPRTVSDQFLEEIAADGSALPLPGDEIERAATLYSLPRWLSDRFVDAVGDEAAPRLFRALCREPDLIFRVRPPHKVADVVQALAGQGVAAEGLSESASAVRILDPGTRVFETSPARDGILQVQDLGSQLIAELCRPPSGFPGARIADLCAGAAGKSIALADLGAEVSAWDASARRLSEGRTRVKTMRAQRVRFEEPRLDKVDVALIDAPCSGTGTLAREPDLKWRLNPKRLDELRATQAKLLADTARALKPGGRIVYATCSLLREENEAQIERVLREVPGLSVEPAEEIVGLDVCHGPFLRVWPHRHPGGGFFAARLVKAG
jgi:16S rRNA (cytosine967-C5)-methyltransferase